MVSIFVDRGTAEPPTEASPVTVHWIEPAFVSTFCSEGVNVFVQNPGVTISTSAASYAAFSTFGLAAVQVDAVKYVYWM